MSIGIDKIEKTLDFYEYLMSKNFKEDVLKIFNMQVYEDLDVIFTSAVDKFYAAYTPNYYTRKKSLYEAYKLSITSNGVLWETGDEFMTTSHEGDSRFKGGRYSCVNEYIFDIAFERGWHGGADSSSKGDHPKEGIPWYRTPPPNNRNITPYTSWSNYAAVNSLPPGKIAEKGISDYNNGNISQYNTSGNTAEKALFDALVEIHHSAKNRIL